MWDGVSSVFLYSIFLCKSQMILHLKADTPPRSFRFLYILKAILLNSMIIQC